MTLGEAWEEQAGNWVRWARAPGHDSYWRFHREAFLSLVPPPGRQTLDVGCGEGRVTRDLRERGHKVIGIDSSPSMIAAARDEDPEGEYIEASAAELPFEDASVDVVVAFMSLMDMDDMDGAVREMRRVLEPGARACIAVVHPINSAGKFADETDDAPFVIESYLGRRPYTDVLERDGLEMTFHSIHFTFEDYSLALEEAGFLTERIREIYWDDHPRWRRVPLFLHLVVVKV